MKNRGNKITIIQPKGFVEEMTSNKFFMARYEEFTEAEKNNRIPDFLKENPEFFQMMMNYSAKLTVIEEE